METLGEGLSVAQARELAVEQGSGAFATWIGIAALHSPVDFGLPGPVSLVLI
jgi:hypothetical protein